jgi:NADPH:quinone reductase-like Zn-dependent oxidoreductase
MAEIVGLVEAGAVRPVVGSVVPFEQVPEAVQALANRETIGRTIILTGN